jgi:DNA gyrase subunit A
MSEIEKKEVAEVLAPLFLTYAKDVIEDRAIPRIQDGLKPVQRRILYDMYIRGNTSHHPTVKSAKTVGSVLSWIHPHGDTSVYDAMVKLSQPFNMRYPLVFIQGNGGSWSGDPAAHFRYTEARMTPVGEMMMEGLDKEALDMVPTFDNAAKEPIALGGYFPNILCNESSGIAVGLATSIPPHYLKDVCQAAIQYINRLLQGKDITCDELSAIIKAPDFPTGGTIINPEDMAEIYRTGQGRVTICGKYRIEEDSRRKRIVFYEMPYKVNYEGLMTSIQKVAEKNPSIRDVRDESSDRDGIRVVIETSISANTDTIVTQLYKYTPLKSNYNCNFVVIDRNGSPRQNVSLKYLLKAYIDTCISTYIRSIQYDTKKYKERLDTVTTTLFASEHAKRILEIIQTKDNPISVMQDEFSIRKEQAELIYDMKIRSVAKLSTQKLRDEAQDLNVRIAANENILKSQELILKNVQSKIKEIAVNHIFSSDKRRTELKSVSFDIDQRDLVPKESVVVMYTDDDRIKCVRTSDFTAVTGSKSKGVRIKLKQTESLLEMLTLSTKDDLLCISNTGRCHILPVYKIPIDTKDVAGGRYLSTMLDLDEGEHIMDIIGVNPKTDNHDGRSLLFTTKNGFIKRLEVTNLSKVARATRCLTFRDGDSLASVTLCNPHDDVIMISTGGKALRIKLDDNTKPVRAQGRTATGVCGMKLPEGESIISTTVVDTDKTFLTVSEHGYVKRMSYNDFTVHGRGTAGSTIKSKKNDILVAAMSVSKDQILVIASKNGQVARIPVAKFAVHSKTANGNYAMTLKDGDIVISAATSAAEEKEEESDAV